MGGGESNGSTLSERGTEVVEDQEGEEGGKGREEGGGGGKEEEESFVEEYRSPCSDCVARPQFVTKMRRRFAIFKP
jgi:hypothetical protein